MTRPGPGPGARARGTRKKFCDEPESKWIHFYRPAIQQQAKALLHNRCCRCGEPLTAIGRKRKNGKDHHEDWGTRILHKTCWKKITSNLF